VTNTISAKADAARQFLRLGKPGSPFSWTTTSLKRSARRRKRKGEDIKPLINEALRAAIQPENAPIAQETLRRIIREELHTA